MAEMWDADFKIDLQTAKEVLTTQFPELEISQVEFLGEGWDNLAILARSSSVPEVVSVFRFPRRHIGVKLIEIESRFLPDIAKSLPIPISAPIYFGKASDKFPYPFAGYPFLEGEPAFDGLKSETLLHSNSRRIAEFLKALHSLPLDEVTKKSAPDDEIGKTNLKRRATRIKERLTKHSGDFDGGTISNLIALSVELAETPPLHREKCWIHGDLYPAHFLIDVSGNVSGVIDWGDLHFGDPALDLSIAFTLLPGSARSAWRESYGEIDEDSWRRARFHAIHYGAVLFDYGRAIANEKFITMGRRALSNVLT